MACFEWSPKKCISSFSFQLLSILIIMSDEYVSKEQNLFVCWFSWCKQIVYNIVYFQLNCIFSLNSWWVLILIVLLDRTKHWTQNIFVVLCKFYLTSLISMFQWSHKKRISSFSFQLLSILIIISGEYLSKEQNLFVCWFSWYRQIVYNIVYFQLNCIFSLYSWWISILIVLLDRTNHWAQTYMLFCVNFS